MSELPEILYEGLTKDEANFLNALPLNQEFNFEAKDEKASRSSEWAVIQSLTAKGYIENNITNQPNGYLWILKRIK